MSVLTRKRSFANRMIKKHGALASLRRNGEFRSVYAAFLEWDPSEKGLRLEGSRHVLISNIDPTTMLPMEVPPDHEQDFLAFGGKLYRLPLPDQGPRLDAVTIGYHDYEAIYVEELNDVVGAAAFVGAGDLTVAISVIDAVTFAASFAGAGDLSASASLEFRLGVDFHGSGDLDVVGVVTPVVTFAVDFRGAADLEANVLVELFFSASFSGAGDLIVAANVVDAIPFAASFVGAGDLDIANFTAANEVTFAANFVGAGDLDAALSSSIRTPDVLFGSNLRGWWKADVGVTLGSGSKVSSWADQSGNGGAFAQATSGDQPDRNLTGFNGLPAIAFNPNNDGTGSYMETGAGTMTSMNSSAMTVWMIAEFRGLGFALNGSHILGFLSSLSSLTYDNTNSHLFFYNPSGGSVLLQSIKNSVVDAEQTIANNTNYRFIHSHDGSNVRYYRDGTLVDTDAATGANSSTGRMTLGSQAGTVANTRARIDVAEVGVVNRILTAGELLELDAYFRNKYGL